jgi:hypothetical protein
MNRANIINLRLLSESLPRAFYREGVAGSPLIEHVLRWWAERRPSEPLAIVCDARQELGPLEEIARPYNVGILHFAERGEAALLRRVCNALGGDATAVVPLAVPLMPACFLERLWDHHIRRGNVLTEALDVPEGASAYIVSSKFVDLLAELSPDPSLSVRRAAHAYRAAKPIIGVPDLPMDPFRLSTQYGVSRSRIPKRLPLDSAEDFNVTAQYIARACQSRADSEILKLLSELQRNCAQRTERQFEPYRRALRQPPRAPGPIRVLYVSAAAGYSGAEESLVRMIAELDRNTVQPYACVSMSGIYTERLAEAGAAVICPESDFSEPRLPNISYLMDIMSEIGPDCVHLNGNCGRAVQIAIGLCRVPMIQHLRSADVREVGDALGLSAAVIAVSAYMQRQIAESVDIDLEKVHVVYDGVDTDCFSPGVICKRAARTRLGIPADAKVALTIARYSPNKRHDLLLHAFARARDACPDAELCLVGEAGWRDAGHFDRIQQMIRELGLETSVRRLGFQPDIRWAECAADVLVLCSEHEPLGLCVLESMALGIPVVVSDGSGMSEVVVDGKHGFVVPQGDTVILADRLVRLLADPAMREALGREARELIESRFTAKLCADRITAIYRGACR